MTRALVCSALISSWVALGQGISTKQAYLLDVTRFRDPFISVHLIFRFDGSEYKLFDCDEVDETIWRTPAAEEPQVQLQCEGLLRAMTAFLRFTCDRGCSNCCDQEELSRLGIVRSYQVKLSPTIPWRSFSTPPRLAPGAGAITLLGAGLI